MKKFLPVLLMLLVIFIAGQVFSQEMKATTETGNEVVLYSNGTWEYNETDEVEISSEYTRPKSAQKHYKGERGTYGIRLDDKLWKPATMVEGSDAEFEFDHVNGDGYAMIIFERIEMNIDALKEIALENAKSVSTNAKIVLEEKRIVNRTEILCLQIEATIQSIEFVYYNYYYVGDTGTIQLITFTGKNLFDEYKSDFENLLNGFEVYK